MRWEHLWPSLLLSRTSFYLMHLVQSLGKVMPLLLLSLIYLLTYLAVPGLSCSMRDLVPRPGIESGPPALGEWSLSHRTTRVVPVTLFCPHFWVILSWAPDGKWVSSSVLGKLSSSPSGYAASTSVGGTCLPPQVIFYLRGSQKSPRLSRSETSPTGDSADLHRSHCDSWIWRVLLFQRL